MGLFDDLKHNVQAFVHSLTTEDHYASFESPYRNNTVNSSSQRLNELNRLSQNNSSSSLNHIQYRPGLRSSTQLNPNSEVQLQDYVNGSPPLPTIESIWNRLDAWYEEEYPELGDNLNYGATAADLNEVENDLNCSLPLDVRQSYQVHDGQMRGGKPSGAIMGLTLLDLEGIFEEYSIWLNVSKRIEKNVYSQQQALHSASSNSSSSKQQKNNMNSMEFVNNQKSIPHGAIQTVYSHPGWIPLVKDWAGNNIAIDLAPGPTGKWGQVILFGRDFDTKMVVANSWNEFLFLLMNDFENGNFIVDELDEDLMFNDLKGRLSNYVEVLKKRALIKYGKLKSLPRVPKDTPIKTDSVEQFELRKETLIDDSLDKKTDSKFVIGSEPSEPSEHADAVEPPLVTITEPEAVKEESLVDIEKEEEVKEEVKEEEVIAKDEPKEEEPIESKTDKLADELNEVEL